MIDTETDKVVALHRHRPRPPRDRRSRRTAATAFVSNRDDGTVSVIDIAALKKVKDITTGALPISLAYSSLARRRLRGRRQGRHASRVIDGETLERGASDRAQARPRPAALRRRTAASPWWSTRAEDAVSRDRRRAPTSSSTPSTMQGRAVPDRLHARPSPTCARCAASA
ncbi:MAG: hypothetical protein MZW92_28855 [Comamonadaceae bacterium]|nr:hypothetical protein [Comamonadaceae bacterium]